MAITDYLPRDLFAGKTVFVTGGGSGINLGVARSFAALGAGVGICGRTAARLESARGELEGLGARVATAVADVRDYAALETALAHTAAELGPVHTLVCGAAGNFVAPAEELSANGFKAVVDIDLLGSFNAARAAFAQLKETRGNIVFISAGQSFTPYFAQVHVGAAKAGVDQLMRNLALEWGRYGIRVNSVAPGPIEGTEGMARLAPTPEIRARLARMVPQGRLGTPGDVAGACLWLGSDAAGYVNGAIVAAVGGWSLRGAQIG